LRCGSGMTWRVSNERQQKQQAWRVSTIHVFQHFAVTDEALICAPIIAVPAHIVARRHDDCSAPILTGWGIVTGIAVTLLCYVSVRACPRSTRSSSMPARGNP